MWTLKGNDTNELTKHKKTHRLRKQTYGFQGGRESQRLWEGHVHTIIFKMDNQQGPIIQHMELSSVLCASLNGMGIWGENRYMYIYG